MWVGVERAVRVGGAGTPLVMEFACAELGLVMGVGPLTAQALVRDAVDLRHRHPVLWAALGAGRGRVWKARQVAKLTHAAGLSRDQARFVDAVTTPYLETLTWSAFTRLVEAKIIEADPTAAEARRLAHELARFVRTGATSEHGIITLIARANAGEVVYFVAMCDRIAAILSLQGDRDPVEVRRSKALAILANPVRALQLLTRHTTTEPHPEDPDRTPPARCTPCARPCRLAVGDVADVVDVAGLDPERFRPKAVLHVRISQHALDGRSGVAYVEGLGSLSVPGLRNLLGHHHVTVRPVLDLRGQVPVEAYEVPAAMREALLLARPTSVFPWTRTTHPDLDHTQPFVPGRKAKQTRVANLGPLDRRGHRIKTHGHGWIHRQPTPGTYLWRTPHGYWYRVDNDGTHPLGRDPDLTAYEPAPIVIDVPRQRHLVELTTSP